MAEPTGASEPTTDTEPAGAGEPTGTGGLACVTGRFQPVHRQHLELFHLAADEHQRLIVAVTNPDRSARHTEPTSAHRHTDQANPLSYYQRARLLTLALDASGLGRRTTVVPFDLTRPSIWPDYVPLTAHQFVRAYSPWEREKAQRLRAAGYPVTMLAGDPATKLDATEVRRRWLAGQPWAELVPASTVALLEALLAETAAGAG